MGVWMGGQYGEGKLAESIRTDAINSARAAMLGLNPTLHEEVALHEQMWSDAHKRALESLIAFHKQYPDVSRVRTFMLDANNSPVVILDTETVAGAVGMQRPVDPTPLRTALPTNDPAYASVVETLRNHQPSAPNDSSYDGYRYWRPGVVPLGTDAAIEADLSSKAQEAALRNLRMWVGTGIGLAVIACGVVALIYFNIRTSHLAAETAGGEAIRSQQWLEQRNSRLVEALGQVVLHRDLRAASLLWDGDTKELFGTPFDRMPITYDEWLERIHPADAERVRAATRHATMESRIYELEYRVRHEDSGWRWFRERGVVSFAAQDDLFQPTTSDSVLEDISGIKYEQDELAALALIASRTDNAVCLTNSQGRVEWANATFQRLTGLSASEVRHSELTELFAGAPGEAAFASLLGEAMAGKGGRAEIQLAHRDGSTYWTNIEIQPLLDEAGQITRLVAIQSDITAAKEFEARLVRAKDAAETAERAKSEFLAVMSHEIRTPLNAVLGFTRLLLDTPLNAQQRDYIDTIRSSGDSLLHLLNDILDFSKMDAASMQLESAPFDLRGCVEDTLDVLIAPASTRGIELIGDIALDTPEAVVGDRGRLRQILLNLVGNAVKFTERGEVSITVRPIESGIVGGAMAPAGSHIMRMRFEVRDTGPGIPTDQQAQLFKPFTQADSSATRKHGGTGLGLAISKRLVSLMDGQIGLHSAPGTGSTFWFEIPLAVADHQPPQTPALKVLQGLRILLVEKNAMQRRVLGSQLSAWGMQVESFGRGRDAIVAAEHRRFDVALLDASPPDMDGLTLIDRLRHLPRRNVGGIILAGPPGRLPVATHGQFDAIQRLVKPIHTSALGDALLRSAPRIGRILPPSRPLNRAAQAAAAVAAIRGSLAAIPIPASQPAEQSPRTPEPLPAIESPAPASRRILVADDNAINRKLVKKMLDSMKFSSELVTNGRECVDAVKNAPASFDAILMDIQMPEMDGIAATRAIRELGSTIPIIALTADAMPDDRARCLAAGMNDYLQKPIRPDMLETALDRAALSEG